MSGLWIEAIRIRPWSAPSPGAGNARRAWTERRGILLELAGGGLTGEGEASPLPGYSPESLDAVERALRDLSPGARIDLSDPLASTRAAVERALPAELPSARFALETAMLTLAARALGVARHRLLGPRGSGPVRVAEVLTDLEEAVSRAEQLLAQGVAAVKLKVGRPGRLGDELAVVEAIRTRTPRLELRLDANRALGREAARRLWPRLGALGVAWVEEPLPPAEWAELPPGGPPLALDESLRGAAGRARAEGLRSGAIILKPAVLGGAVPCLELADRAPGAVPVASHLFDGPVAAAATADLALALPREAAQGLGLARAGGAVLSEPGGPR